MKWTPRARRIGRALQSTAGGLVLAACIVAAAWAPAIAEAVAR